MEYQIKKLSTNRFKINGIVYKRIKSTSSCNGCHFYRGDRCLMNPGPHCQLECFSKTQYYHLIPNEL